MKTLVLDLDYTLICADILERGGHDGATLGETGDFEYYVWLRPGVKEFLNFAFTNFEVHLCTAGTLPYVRQIIKLLDIPAEKFKSVLTRENLDQEEVFNGYSMNKEYIKVWDNAIAVDDKTYIYRGNNLRVLKVNPYFPSFAGEVNPDKELFRVKAELENILKEPKNEV